MVFVVRTFILLLIILVKIDCRTRRNSKNELYTVDSYTLNLLKEDPINEESSGSGSGMGSSYGYPFNFTHEYYWYNSTDWMENWEYENETNVGVGDEYEPEPLGDLNLSEEEFEGQIKNMYGKRGVMRDLAFFSVKEQEDYFKTKGNPLEHFVEKFKNKTKDRNVTTIELLLSRVIKLYRGGEYKKKIEKAIIPLEALMKEIEEQTTIENESKTNSKDERIKSEVLSISNEINDIYREVLGHEYHDANIEKVKRYDEEIYAKMRKRSNENSPPRSAGDHTYVKRGESAGNPHTACLCNSWLKKVDLGVHLKPRYVTSLECDKDRQCLLGDGICQQRIIMVTMNRRENLNGDWYAFKYALKYGCFCEVRRNSMIHQHYVN